MKGGGWAVARGVLVVGGLGLLAGSAWVPGERFADGGRSLEPWWVAMGGLAVTVAALGLGTSWARAGCLAAALLAGTAAQLGLTRPKWLQHLWVRSHDLERPLVLLALAVVGTQALVVAWHLRGRMRRLLVEGLRVLAAPSRAALIVRVAGCLVIFGLCAVHATLYIPRGNPRGYGVQLLATALLFGLSLATLVAVGATLPSTLLKTLSARLREAVSLPGDPDRGTRLDRLLPWILAAFAGAMSAILSRCVLEGVPHIPDGVAYHFQAQCFAAGQLRVPAPPVPEAFRVYLITVKDGWWFATTPPGWPLVLALGVLAGVPWLVNPVLGALAVLVAHALTKRLADRGTAHLLSVLLATSPWFLWLSASWMTHALSLVLVLGAWGALVGARRPGGALRALAAGGLLGFLVLVRPLEGLVAGAFTGLVLLLVRVRLRSVLLFSLGCILLAGLTLPYNHHYTGDPLTFPINDYTDTLWYPGANALGFGPEVGNPTGRWGELDPYPGHGWRDVLLNANQNFYNLNFELLGWPVGGLLLAVIHVLWGRRSRVDRAALGLVLAIVLACSLYWFSGGPDYGARYWYVAIFPLLWLSVRGLGTLVQRVGRSFPGSQAAARIGLCCVLLVALNLTVFMSWRAVARYTGYRRFHGGYARLLQERRFEDGLVLVGTPWDAEYGCAFLLNDPRLPPSRPVFARDCGKELNNRLIEAFPGRRVFHVAGAEAR